jgi:hypothetical protein
VNVAATAPNALTRPQPHALRVAAVWGTTIVGVKVLDRGLSCVLGSAPGCLAAIPDGLTIPPIPLHAVAGGWELDPRGAVGGVLKLRGRDEDPAHLAQAGAPVPILPGDYGLLQYGLFSIFFQYTTPGRQIAGGTGLEPLVLLSLFSSIVFHVGLLGFLRITSTPPPLGKPPELYNPEDWATLFNLKHVLPESEPPPAAASKDDKAGGTGVKDPGAKDPKKQGGGQKIVGAEGKAGLKGKEDHTELPGEIKPTTNYGGLSDVLQSDTGNEIKNTLKSIDTVASALGGLNSNNVVLGAGPGTGLHGTGAGGGGTGAGVMFGSGTLNTGWGPGSGGGFGSGSGGPGGKGSGGFGSGGSGGGSGGGNGPGSGPGEHGIAGGGAGGASKGGLSPEQVRRVVVAHQGALRACYEIEAQKDPSLRGGVTVAWTIDPSGSVTSASLAGSSIRNPRVEGCVVRQVRTWRFPTSEAPTMTTFPFKFGVG